MHLVSFFANAQTPPMAFTYQGRLYKPNGTDTVNSNLVSFRAQIYSPDGNCLLFEETHTRDMSSSDGMFSLNIGSGTSSLVSSLTLFQIFENSSAKSGAAGCNYVPAAGDIRRLRLGYNDGTDSLTFSNDQIIQSVPYAMTAQNLEGVSKAQLLQVSSQTTQVKVDAVFAGYANLMALINGSSTVYSKASDLPIANGVLNLSSGGVTVSDAPASGQYAVNKNYSDARLGGQLLDVSSLSNGQSLTWNSTMNKWQSTTPSTGTVTSVIAGAGLSGGTITGSGTIALTNVGTAGTYTKITTDAQGRVTFGSPLANTDLPAASGDVTGAYASLTVGKLRGIALSIATPTGGQVLKYNSTTTQWEPAIDSSNVGTVTTVSALSPFIVATGSSTPVLSLQSGTSTGQNLVWDGSNWSSGFTNIANLRNSFALAQFPTTTCGTSKTLVYQVPTDTYSCSDIAISSSQVSGLGAAAALNVGTTAGTVAAGNDSRIVAALQSTNSVAGDLSGTLAAPTVSKIKGVALSSTAPTDGQVLKYNNSTSQWEPSTDNSNSGTVTSIAAGAGLSGGTITGSGTISLSNIGTAGSYAKVTTDAQGRVTSGSSLTSSDLPAATGDVSGSYSALMVGKIRGVAVASLAPGDGQVLKYNATTVQWEPSSLPTNVGTVTTVSVSAPLRVSNASSTPAISLVAGATSGQNLTWDGSSWAAGFSTAANLKSAAGLSQLPTTTCAASKTLVYQVPSDTYSCSDIEITSSQVSGLGAAAALNVGTTAGTVAAGNDSRIVGALQSTSTVTGDLSGTLASPMVVKMKGVALSSTAPTDGQVLKYSDSTSQWEPSNDNSNSGTVTSITAGAGLSGGIITGSGTISLLNVGTAGTYAKVTTDAQGRVILGTNLSNADLPTPTGDVTGTYAALVVSKIKGVAVSATAPTAGQFLKYNSSISQWEPGPGNVGTVTTVTASSPLSVSNASSTPVISLAAGTGAGQNLSWDGSNWFAAFTNLASLKSAAGLVQLPTTTCAVSKTLVYQVPSDTYACSDIAISSSQVSGLGAAAALNVGTTTGTVAAGNDARIVGALQSTSSVAGDLSGTLATPTVAKIKGVAVSATAPTNGQILKYNSTTSQWEPGTDNSNVGTVTSLTAGTGLSGGTITGSGTISLPNVGTAGTYAKITTDAQGRVSAGTSLVNTDIPAPAGDVIGAYAALVVSKLRGVAVSATSPTSGQILKYNSTTSQWEPGTDNSNVGTVTSVAAGTGLTGGTVTASGTLAVDVGTTANKIVQLDSSARLPAVDGSQLTALPVPFSNAQAFNTSGTFTWTVPANVTKVFVQAWGGGAGGGGGANGGTAGGGGAAGGFSSGFVTVTAGGSVAVTVGAGGAATADGTVSNFSTFIVANGGVKGLASSNAISAGGTGSGTSALITVAGGSGSGGSSYVLGVNASGGTGGTAGGGGGSGGGAGGSGSVAGGAGAQPGGGGGGGGSSPGSAAAGGAGGAGRVIVWY